jgi:regulator of sigma E protease
VLADPPPSTPAAAADVRGGDRVVAVDGEPIGSWQELRWKIVRAQGNDHVALSLARDNVQNEQVEVTLPLANLDTADWEGNPLSALGLRADLGPPIVDQVLPGKPAERAGIRAGDRIVAVDGTSTRSPSDVASLTNAHPGGTLTYRVQRNDSTIDVPVTAEAVEQNGRRIGLAGVRLRIDSQMLERSSVTVRYGLGESLQQGARKTWELSAFTVRMLGRIVTGDASLKNISGPLTMADIAGQSAQAGLLVFVGYLALISISLGVLNLLPIPLLDGGHLMYYIFEVFKGSPVSDKAIEIGQHLGMALLFVLMAFALYNDINRLISG